MSAKTITVGIAITFTIIGLIWVVIGGNGNDIAEPLTNSGLRRAEIRE